MPPIGTFDWTKLLASDQAKSNEFFSKLLGWNRGLADMEPMSILTLFRLTGKDIAGMTDPLTDYTKNHAPFWSTYIEVDDVDALAANVENLGGQIVAPPQDVPAMGRVCMISDPAGSSVCLMAPPTLSAS
ncbi:VOC family protein [Yoonia sp.]|uniref:VOC family protein n=1 Tax=Yoonia sp. TaxID=2212373 RepID=UPI0025D2FBDC|nr:VOC family protein [Yoonia sp.]